MVVKNQDSLQNVAEIQVSYKTTDTPKEKWIQIDVPSFNGGNWNGGVISFLPGPLQDKNYFEKGIQYDINDNNGKETKKPDKKTKNSKKNNIENIILIIIGIVVLIVGAYIYYKITSNKPRYIICDIFRERPYMEVKYYLEFTYHIEQELLVKHQNIHGHKIQRYFDLNDTFQNFYSTSFLIL